MRRFLFLLTILAFVFISCSQFHTESNTTDISFSGTNVLPRSIVEGFDESAVFSITLELVEIGGGGYYVPIVETGTLEQLKNKTYSFKKIPIGITVNVKCVIVAEDIILYQGESESITIKHGENSVAIISNTYFVRGSPNADRISSTLWGTGSDTNSGNFMAKPLATVQTAIEKIIADNVSNPGAKEYTIYVKDTVYAKQIDTTTYQTADFSGLDNTALKVKIIGEGSDATLSAYASANDTTNYAVGTIKTAEKLELTLKNLTIIGESHIKGKDTIYSPAILLAGCTLNIDGKITIENKILADTDNKGKTATIRAVSENSSIIRKVDGTLDPDTMLCVNYGIVNLNTGSRYRLTLDGNIPDINSTTFNSNGSKIISINEGDSNDCILTAENCTIKNNYKYSDWASGGAIGMGKGKATFKNCEITNCVCFSSSSISSSIGFIGGVFVTKGDLTLIDTQIDCASNKSYGNGVYLQNDSTITFGGKIYKKYVDGEYEPFDLEITGGSGIILRNDFDSSSKIMITTEEETGYNSSKTYIKMEDDNNIGNNNKAFSAQKANGSTYEITNTPYTVTTEGKIEQKDP